jgi:multiple sugar transport system substrate-binding protein
VSEPGATSRNRSLTRRAALGTLGAAALGAALWPRHPREREAIPSGRVVIEYWEKWTGVEGEALQRVVVDRFNASQDRVWVRRIPVSEIAPKAAVAIGGGDPPDVVGLYSYNIPQFAESRGALPFDELGAGGTRIDPAIYAPAVRRLLTYEGRQWAGVNTVYTLALYYNRAMFREAGLDPERPPRTIPELDGAADRLVVRRSGRIERAGFLPNMPESWPYSWPVMFGGRLYDPATNRAVFADDATVAAYEWVQSYPRRLGVEASREFGHSHNRSFNSVHDPFFSGRVAMIVQGPWITNFMATAAPGLDYGAGPVPVAESIYDPERPAGLVEADVLIIPRGCRHPEEAFEFVRYTQRREVQEALAAEHCKSSPMAEVAPEFFARHGNRCVRVHDAVTHSPRVEILPQTRVWQQYADMTAGAFDRVWSGEPVRPVLLGVEQRVQTLLDLAAERRRQRGGVARRGPGGAAAEVRA